MSADETRLGGPRQDFPSTRWSLVRAAGEHGSSAGKDALDGLVRAYWKPVYAFIRRYGRSIEDAKDLTQAFFQTALRRNLAGRADREQGRFRAFLLTSIRNFLRDEHEREAAARRGGPARKAMLDLEAVSPAELEAIGAPAGTPEEAFQRQWALGLLEETLAEVRRHYAAEGRTNRARLFERYIDLLVSGAPVDYASLSRDFDLSETDVTNYLHRAKLLYRQVLREKIRDSVAQPEDVEGEIQDLFRFLG